MLWLLFFFSMGLKAQVSPDARTLLKEIVEINSSTDNAEGLDKIRARLIPEFEALGFKTTLKEVGPGHKVISFSLPDSKPKVALIGHVDTVFPLSSPFKAFQDTGKEFKGPGVNDMKGGIVMMLEVLKELKKEGGLESLMIILNDDEEIGSPNSAAYLKELTKGVPYGLVYEPTLTSPEHVTTTQAGVEWLEIKVKGRASHAGAEHEKGINACVELSHIITKIASLTNYKKKLTVNPGVIQGGTKANVVCEEASLRMDVRYVEEKDLKELRKKIDRIVKKGTIPGTLSSLTELVHISSLPPKTTEGLFEKAAKAGKQVGLKLKKEHMGGASDANQLAVTGMELLAGLGPWGKGAHSETEQMDVESFEQRKLLSVHLIRELLLGKN